MTQGRQELASGENKSEEETRSEVAAEEVVVATDKDEPVVLPAEEDDIDAEAEVREFPDPEPVSQRAAPERSATHPLLWALAGSAVSLAVVTGFYLIESRQGGLFDNNSAAISELTQRLSAAESEGAALRSELNSLSDTARSLEVVASQNDQGVASLSKRIDNIPDPSDALAKLEQRVVDLENRPIPDVGATQDAVQAYERELAAMREMLAEELDRIRSQSEQTVALAEQAVQADRSGAARTISAEIQDAIVAGRSLQPLLAEAEAEGLNVPAILVGNADSLLSLSDLQISLADLAREVVADDVRQKAQDGEIGRVEAFLRLQLGARSLAPAEGDEPEQVLARAEAELAKGNVDAALAEVERLGEIDALGPWIASARQFLSAINATADITANIE